MAPPRSDGGNPAGSTPQGLLGPASRASDCPRRECPAPADVMAGLEQRIGERLDRERQAHSDGLALLGRQRAGFADAVTEMVAGRRTAAAAAEAALRTETDQLKLAETAGALAVDASATSVLSDAVGLGLPAPAPVASAPGSGGGAPAPNGQPRQSRPTQAQHEAPREGKWILPIIRTLARLRARFEDVASVRAESAALASALHRVESRLRDERDRVRSCAAQPEPPPAPVEAPAAAGPRHGPPPPPPPDLSESLLGAYESGRRDACARAAADFERALDAFDSARPSGCGTVPGSTVCRPPAVEGWIGSELEGLDLTDPADYERLIKLLDQFLGPGGLAGTPPVGGQGR